MANQVAQQALVMRPTCLYNNGYIIDFPSEGESLLLRDKIVFVIDETDSWYTVLEGDRLDLIAFNRYEAFINRSAELWWVIADANNIFNPFDLSAYVGNDIVIPSFDKLSPYL